MNIIIFIVILVVLILVHEFGHFIVAKKSGIRVDEFGIGFPPKLFGKKYGETEYTFNLLPFGGFVRIFGENPDKESINGEDSGRSLVNKPKYIQALVMFAGVGFNILTAWLLFSVIYMVGMPTVFEEGDNKFVQNPALTIVEVLPETPAEYAGLKVGDKLLSFSVNNESISELTSEKVSDFVALHGKDKIYVEYKRGNDVFVLDTVPETNIIPNEPERAVIGIAMSQVGTLKLPVHLAFWEAGKLTAKMFVAVTVAITQFLFDAITLNADFSQIAGPVGIVGIVGDAAALGIISLLSFTAFISLNLAVINLLPLPALDGGRLLFVAIEAIKGSPIKPSIVNMLNMIGFALLILLMVVVTYNDIAKIFN